MTCRKFFTYDGRHAPMSPSGYATVCGSKLPRKSKREFLTQLSHTTHGMLAILLNSRSEKVITCEINCHSKLLISVFILILSCTVCCFVCIEWIKAARNTCRLIRHWQLQQFSDVSLNSLLIHEV